MPRPEEGGAPDRALGTWPAVSLVAGSMLGVGIFISPAEVARSVGSDFAFYVVWALGGITALAGSLSLAELGAMMPRSGGDYTYLRSSWGEGLAFAVGWLQLLAIFPGSLATVAVAVATFQLPTLFGEGTSIAFIPGLSAQAAWAGLLIVMLTLINHLGVRLSGVVQVGLTTVPLVVFLLLAVALLTSGHPGASSPAAAPEATPWTGYAKAYLAVYFAYSGWNSVIYVAGEVDRPGRNLPRALVAGTGAVTVLYMLLCAAFLSVFGLVGLRDVVEAGSAAAGSLFGPLGTWGITFVILLAMLATLNGTILGGSRIGYAMAQHGDFPRVGARFHARFGTPTVPLWVQAGISIALLLATTHLDELIAYTSTAMLITGSATVAAVAIFRRKQPGLERPYRTRPYPLAPLVYITSSLLVVVLTTLDGDPGVLVAVAWFAAALVVYAVLRRRRSAA